jgi:hypothetical protein
MKKKRWTPEEWREYKRKSEELQRLLHEYIDRITAELEAKKKKPA